MTITTQKGEKSTITLTITVATNEQAPFIQKAAETVGKHLNVSGFRSGHIPFDIVKKEVGDIRLLEVASEEMVKRGLIQAVTENKLETVGNPQITIKTMVPGNDFVAEVVWALMPSVTLPKLTDISVTKKEVTALPSDLEGSLQELRKMRASEAATTEGATRTSRVVIDMVISLEKVPVEGGTAKNHSIVLDETTYVPGLTDALIGVKKGEHKEFTLKFPENYFQKLLAGKDAEFAVDVHEVYERALPEINDEFAKALHFETLAELKEILTKNITLEKQQEEEQRFRAELLETIVEKTTFGDVPEILINAEKERLFSELRAQIENQGMSFEQYLADVKQTPEQIAEGMTDSAKKRVTISLMLREVAKAQNITLTKEEMDAEIEAVRNAYHDNPNIEERLHDENIVAYIRMNATHRKVTDELVKQCVK